MVNQLIILIPVWWWWIWMAMMVCKNQWPNIILYGDYWLVTLFMMVCWQAMVTKNYVVLDFFLTTGWWWILLLKMAVLFIVCQLKMLRVGSIYEQPSWLSPQEEFLGAISIFMLFSHGFIDCTFSATSCGFLPWSHVPPLSRPRIAGSCNLFWWPKW